MRVKILQLLARRIFKGKIDSEEKDFGTIVELLKKDYLLKTEKNLKQKIGEIIHDFINRGLYNSTHCTGKQLQAHFDHIDKLIDHIVKSLEEKFTDIPLEQFKGKLLTITDEEYKKLVPFANSHLVNAGLAQQSNLKNFEQIINNKKEKTKQAIETRFAILEKQKGMLESKPPEFLQKILWVLRYGGKYWWLLVLALLVLFIYCILLRLNPFGMRHQNIHPEAKTSGDSSPAIVSSGPNSPVTVHYNIDQSSNVYRPLYKEMRENLITDLERIRKYFNDLDVRISVTSDKGNNLRRHVAEEISDILSNAGYDAKVNNPIIRFSNDTSDVVIKLNEDDAEFVKQLCKVLKQFIKTNTPFSGMKNVNLQRGELQIIIAGDPLFSPEGIVTFQ